MSSKQLVSQEQIVSDVNGIMENNIYILSLMIKYGLHIHKKEPFIYDIGEEELKLMANDITNNLIEEYLLKHETNQADDNTKKTLYKLIYDITYNKLTDAFSNQHRFALYERLLQAVANNKVLIRFMFAKLGNNKAKYAFATKTDAIKRIILYALEFYMLMGKDPAVLNNYIEDVVRNADAIKEEDIGVEIEELDLTVLFDNNELKMFAEYITDVILEQFDKASRYVPWERVNSFEEFLVNKEPDILEQTILTAIELLTKRLSSDKKQAMFASIENNPNTWAQLLSVFVVSEGVYNLLMGTSGDEIAMFEIDYQEYKRYQTYDVPQLRQFILFDLPEIASNVFGYLFTYEIIELPRKQLTNADAISGYVYNNINAFDYSLLHKELAYYSLTQLFAYISQQLKLEEKIVSVLKKPTVQNKIQKLLVNSGGKKK